MASPILLQGTNYHTILGGDDYNLVATDINGKAFQEITVVYIADGNDADLYLPEIASLPTTAISIRVIAQDTDGATNQVAIRPASGSSDTIGSLTVKSLSKDGSNFILTPADATTWSLIYSE
jgi:hypothetical protein